MKFHHAKQYISLLKSILFHCLVIFYHSGRCPAYTFEATMMPIKIPSSRSLLAFAAAANHDNFARAAQALSLTEGAKRYAINHGHTGRQQESGYCSSADFSCRWLIPHLASFYAQPPDITVNVAARTDPFILTGSGFDAVVHIDHPAWAGMYTLFLFQDTLLPECHPALLKNKENNVQLNELPRIHRRQNPQA
ncbi:LysR family transcriptional regulator|nr:LysR family transcriptional regulator [Candidatus Pantoea persica]